MSAIYFIININAKCYAQKLAVLKLNTMSVAFMYRCLKVCFISALRFPFPPRVHVSVS